MPGDGWYEVREFDDGMVGIAEPGHDEDVRSYLVRGRDRALLIDTGTGIGDIRAVVEALTDRPMLLVNSHGHWDHIGGDWRFAPVWIHAAEADRPPAGVPNALMGRRIAAEHLRLPLPDGVDPDTFAIPPAEVGRVLHGGEVIDLGDRAFTVVHTPGHSPGGISLIDERRGIAIVGDALYAGPLYGHLDGSDPAAYRETLRRLAALAPDLRRVYPGHNDYPLDPVFLLDALRGMEEVWSGRAPDRVSDGVEEHVFGRYSLLLREGWRGR